MIEALKAALRADLARQHQELGNQVLCAYGIQAMHRNRAWTWDRWGW